MATRIERRHHHELEDWQTFYREAEQNGDVICHQWYIDNRLCDTPEAARTQAKRHVEAGLLARRGTYPQSYLILNNVTLSTVSNHGIDGKRTLLVSRSLADQAGGVHETVQARCNTLQTLPNIASMGGRKEHSVCNISSSKERVRDHRKRQKVNNISCSCTPTTPCDNCYHLRVNTRLNTAYNALHGPRSPCFRYFPRLGS